MKNGEEIKTSTVRTKINTKQLPVNKIKADFRERRRRIVFYLEGFQSGRKHHST